MSRTSWRGSSTVSGPYTMFPESIWPSSLDEYGTVQGIVALVDLLEGLVGDIPHIDELGEPQILRRSDGSWLVDGTMPVDDFIRISGGAVLC